jgi:hypothetical protein
LLIVSSGYELGFRYAGFRGLFFVGCAFLLVRRGFFRSHFSRFVFVFSVGYYFFFFLPAFLAFFFVAIAISFKS